METSAAGAARDTQKNTALFRIEGGGGGKVEAAQSCGPGPVEEVAQAALLTLFAGRAGLLGAVRLGGFLTQFLGALLGVPKVKLHGGFLGARAAAAASLDPALMNLWCAAEGSGHIRRVAHTRCADWPRTGSP